MTNWTDNLTTFNLDGISAMPEAGPDLLAEVESELTLLPHLDQDERHEVDGIDRKFRDAQQVKTAAEAIARVPGPRQAVHLAIGGRFALWDCVPAVLHLSGSARIVTLTVATLGFSRSNVGDLCGMLDKGTIGSARLLCSHYFRGTSGGIYEFAAEEIARRSDRAAFLSVRTHAKILLIRLDDGRTVTVESSANLRSCKNIEQLTLFGDPGLHDFHDAWIGRLFTAATAGPEAA